MKYKRFIFYIVIICIFATCFVFFKSEKQDSEVVETERENQSHTTTGIQSHDIPVSDIIEPLSPGDIVSNATLEAKGIDSLFYSMEITEELQGRILGNSYRENDNIALSELRYLRVLYYGFDGETHIGELIVNQKIEVDILEIMQELYENLYPIEKMVLIDEYDADDESSMADNNTSAFNYRSVNGSSKLSKHSLGVAIDINPRFNPCVRTINGALSVEPANGTEYADRTQEFPHKITEQDLCYRLFTEHGFVWGGSWNSVKDYQHFEKDI